MPTKTAKAACNPFIVLDVESVTFNKATLKSTIFYDGGSTISAITVEVSSNP